MSYWGKQSRPALRPVSVGTYEPGYYMNLAPSNEVDRSALTKMDWIRADLDRILEDEVRPTGVDLFADITDRKFKPPTNRDLEHRLAHNANASIGGDTSGYLKKAGGSLILPRG